MCRDDCSFIGGDFCQNFLKMVQKKENEAIQINIKTLPFLNNTFDHVICVAVIHHIKDKSDQIKAIKELVRVTKIKGTILITVWEAHGEYKKGDNYVDWYLQKKYNKEESKEVVFKRYYYMYDDNELYKDIFRSISNIMIESFKSSHNNRFVIITKL
jgi:ubiquinone/menaquinone biosynthesis C-methylase UbiE